VAVLVHGIRELVHGFKHLFVEARLSGSLEPVLIFVTFGSVIESIIILSFLWEIEFRIAHLSGFQLGVVLVVGVVDQVNIQLVLLKTLEPI